MRAEPSLPIYIIHEDQGNIKIMLGTRNCTSTGFNFFRSAIMFHVKIYINCQVIICILKFYCILI